MNKKFNNRILIYAKKLKSINYRGGECKKCGEKNISKLTFHHLNTSEKEFSYTKMKDRRWSLLKKEIDKCDVLCQNCHRELHYEINNVIKDDRRIDKKIYLEYAGSKCERCGYEKCPASLTFHHKDPSEKKFWIGSLSERMNSINDLSDMIKSEIDKCELLCANCHSEEHFDRKFYDDNEDLIIEKSLNYREINMKINRNLIYDLYVNKKLRQIDIAKKLKVPKSTICGIIKEITNENKR